MKCKQGDPCPNGFSLADLCSECNKPVVAAKTGFVPEDGHGNVRIAMPKSEDQDFDPFVKAKANRSKYPERIPPKTRLSAMRGATLTMSIDTGANSMEMGADILKWLRLRGTNKNYAIPSGWTQYARNHPQMQADLHAMLVQAYIDTTLIVSSKPPVGEWTCALCNGRSPETHYIVRLAMNPTECDLATRWACDKCTANILRIKLGFWAHEFVEGATAPGYAQAKIVEVEDGTTYGRIVGLDKADLVKEMPNMKPPVQNITYIPHLASIIK